MIEAQFLWLKNYQKGNAPTDSRVLVSNLSIRIDAKTLIIVIVFI